MRTTLRGNPRPIPRLQRRHRVPWLGGRCWRSDPPGALGLPEQNRSHQGWTSAQLAGLQAPSRASPPKADMQLPRNRRGGGTAPVTIFLFQAWETCA